jgi:tetratricopeptide (TPR) repeat protein
MKIFYTAFLILIIFISCEAQEKEVDNTKPLYGEIEKSKEHKEIDNKFIGECLEQFGSIDNSVNVQIDHAWRYYYNNDLKKAMKRFNQAWLLNSEFPDSFFGFAALLEMQDKTKEAKRFYKMGMEKDIENNRAEVCYQRIADCKEQLGDINGTIKAYATLAELNPNNSSAFKKLGYLQMQSGLTIEAINTYDKAIDLDPNDGTTYNNRGYLYQTKSNYEAAIKDYSKAIELNPDFISALVNRGITEMQIKQFEKAKSDFEKCIQLDPKAGELRRFLGLAELNLNNISAACKDFGKALQLGDQDVVQLIKENCKN